MAVIESDLGDIQFLGNWNSQQPSSPSSFVSAIVLTPESSPSEIPRTFSRIQTSVVHVGRTPAVDSALPADDRATFSNPVMSRNHAKITFADSGSVFVIDTNSHHGTRVARFAVEFKLGGESPFQLQDGDRLTFGKEVQRNGVLHSPLTVTVKLLQSVSTPSAMSISSTSVSPASKFTSPRPRNRFGLDPSSDSDASSDNEDSREDSRESDPCTGSNAIRVDLPFHRSDGGISLTGGPKSPKITTVVQSELSSPLCKNHEFPTSERSSPLRICPSPITGPKFPSDLLSPPGLELEGMGVPADAAHEASSSSNAHQSPTPPWRRSNESAWPNLSIFDRMPDVLQEHPRRIGRLLNPLWMRASMVSGGEERGGRPSLMSRLQNSGDAVDVFHEIHDHHVNHDQLHHAFSPSHIHHGPHIHSHGYGHGRHGVRLDANWGLYGQNGEALKEVQTLNERVEGLKKDVENMKTKGDGDERLDLVFSRLDELSSQLKDTIADNAKVSQHTSLAESADLEALKNSFTALQDDLSILKAHKSAMQTDIRFLFLRANHEELKSNVRDSSEKHTNDTSTLTDDNIRMRQDEAALRDELNALKNQAASNVLDLTPLKTDMSEASSDIESLRIIVRSVSTSLEDIHEEIHALERRQASAEQELPSRIEEQVRTEIRALIQQEGEVSSIIGKRKRGDDESPDMPVAGNFPVTSVSRPRKRLRIVVDVAAAGALGALGAWLGLAFL